MWVRFPRGSIQPFLEEPVQSMVLLIPNTVINSTTTITWTSAVLPTVYDTVEKNRNKSFSEGHSNQDPRCNQKPIHKPIFTHHIRSWLLCTYCTPVNTYTYGEKYCTSQSGTYHIPGTLVIRMIRARNSYPVRTRYHTSTYIRVRVRCTGSIQHSIRCYCLGTTQKLFPC